VQNVVVSLINVLIIIINRLYCNNDLLLCSISGAKTLRSVEKKRQCELQVTSAICNRPATSDPDVNSTSLLHLSTQQTVDLFHPGTIYLETR
jgi:hypothetical protein